MRVLRLVAGIFVITQGVLEREWVFIVLGAVFSLMPLLNMGCCSTSGCNVPLRRSNENSKDINFEEVK